MRTRRWLMNHGSAAPPPPTGQRFNGGFAIALARDQIFTGGGAGVYHGIPHPGNVDNVGPVSPGVVTLMVPHQWNEIEPTAGTYAFGNLADEIAQCAAYNTGNTPQGVQYILKLIVKSFNTVGGNPLPADLAAPIGHSGDSNYSPDGYCTFFSGGGGTGTSDGYSVWRWHPVIVARLANIFAQLGTAFGSNVNFAGISMQETAVGYTPVTAVDGYGSDNSKFCDALVAESLNIAAASPNIRPYPFINFLPAGGNAQATIDLANVARRIRPSGAIVGYPDQVTDLSSSGIVQRVYDIISAYQTGGSVSRVITPGNPPTIVQMGTPGGTFGSIQDAEWTGNKQPADGAPTGTVSIMDLVNYATQSFFFTPSTTPGDAHARDHRPGKPLASNLNVPMMVLDWHNNGTPQFNHAATDVFANMPAPFAGAWAP